MICESFTTSSAVCINYYNLSSDYHYHNANVNAYVQRWYRPRRLRHYLVTSRRNARSDTCRRLHARTHTNFRRRLYAVSTGNSTLWSELTSKVKQWTSEAITASNSCTSLIRRRLGEGSPDPHFKLPPKLSKVLRILKAQIITILNKYIPVPNFSLGSQ